MAKRGRKPLPPGDVSSEQFRVRFKPGEAKAIRMRARAAKTTTAQWLQDRVRTALGLLAAVALVTLFDWVAMMALAS